MKNNQVLLREYRNSEERILNSPRIELSMNFEPVKLKKNSPSMESCFEDHDSTDYSQN